MNPAVHEDEPSGPTPAGQASLAHPAGARGRIGAWRMLTSLFGAPLAWMAQMSLSEPLAAQSCYPHAAPLLRPALPHLQLLLAAVTVGALGVGAACILLAWSTLQRARSQDGPDSSEGGAAVETGDGRSRFLAVTGFMSSVLFLCAILITGLAVLIVSPCRSWS